MGIDPNSLVLPDNWTQENVRHAHVVHMWCTYRAVAWAEALMAAGGQFFVYVLFCLQAVRLLGHSAFNMYPAQTGEGMHPLPMYTHMKVVRTILGTRALLAAYVTH